MKPWFSSALAQCQTYIDSAKLPHALIISGTQGIGKLEFAQLLASRLSGVDVSGDNLAEVDDQLLLRNSHYQHLIYLMRERGKSGKVADTISVHQIRAGNEFLTKTSEKLQIAIIAYGNELTTNASNALLKTLEEPREHTLIIILAHNIRQLPITIVSRCAKLHLGIDTNESQILEWIRSELAAENSYSDSMLKTLLRENNNTPPLVVEKIRSNIYQIEHQVKQELLEIAHTPTQLNTVSHKDNPALVLDCLYHLARELSEAKLRGATYAKAEQLLQQVKLSHLAKLLADITHAQYLLETTVNSKLMIDNILIVWSHIGHMKKYPVIFTE